MIPLVTDLNRCATMTHQLNDTTPDFEVGDRVVLNFPGDHECNGRRGTVRGDMGLQDGTIPVVLDDSPYTSDLQRVTPRRLTKLDQ